MPDLASDSDTTGATPRIVLDAARHARAIADESERQILRLAAMWADAHPDLDQHGQVRWWRPKPKSLDDLYADALTDGAALSASAGEVQSPDEMDHAYEWHGIPGIAWDAPAGFAAAVNTTTTGGKALIRDVLILRHRLPKTWAKVLSGDALAWRVRRVAQAVIGAPADVAAFVDDHVADRIATIGMTALGRTLQEAILRLHAELVEIRSLEALDACHVTLHPQTLNDAGIVDLDVRGEWGDLVDFDRAVARIAAALKVSEHPRAHECLGTRRAAALGIMVDPHAHAALLDQAFGDTDSATKTQAAADRSPDPDAPGDAPVDEPATHTEMTRPSAPVTAPATDAPAKASPLHRGPSAREMVLYVHLTDAALLGIDPLARDEHGRIFLAQSVAAWAGRPGQKITVRPVLDLTVDHTRDHAADHPDTGRVSPQLAEQTALRDPTCVYPWCTRPARRCDKDHLRAHGDGGATCVCNLAPLCRGHHQLKTHAGWSYERLAPHLYLWRDPHGLYYLHTPDGTRPLNGPSRRHSTPTDQDDEREPDHPDPGDRPPPAQAVPAV